MPGKPRLTKEEWRVIRAIVETNYVYRGSERRVRLLASIAEKARAALDSQP
jgi:hypothetical protein